MKYFYKFLVPLAGIVVIQACSENIPVSKNKQNSNPTNPLVSYNPTNSSNRASQIGIAVTAFDQATYEALTPQQFAWGGMMYDKWWTTDINGTVDKAIVPPADNQTWVGSGNISNSGSSTWRCKSCHGWDYIGADGIYSDPADSHYTGFPGIIPSTNNSVQKTLGDPVAIFNVIDTGVLPDGSVIIDHDFGSYVSDPIALYAVTNFVQRMHMEAMTPFPGSTVMSSPQMLIDNLAVVANELEGHEHYHLATPQSIDLPVVTKQGGCDEGCHGEAGTAIVLNDGDPTLPLNVTDMILNNAAEALHKIRFGKPGVSPQMPGLDWYDNPNIMQDTSLVVATNILAFARDGLMADHARGGRLYDNWVLETGVAAPAESNPLLAVRDPNPADITADKEWLCSSCHGYDYEGVAGFQNNLVELSSVREWDIAYLYNYLKNGRSAFIGGSPVKSVHNFGAKLNDGDLWNVSEFLMEGVVDTHSYISLGLGGRALGEGLGLHGEDIYFGSMSGVLSAPSPWACVECHTDSGDGAGIGASVAAPPAKNIFAASWVDVAAPWRAFHRIRFGMPGLYDLDGDGVRMERMPGLTEIVLESSSNQEIPRDEKQTLRILAHRSMDLLTYSQDRLLENSPAKVNQVRALISRGAN